MAKESQRQCWTPEQRSRWQVWNSCPMLWRTGLGSALGTVPNNERAVSKMLQPVGELLATVSPQVDIMSRNPKAGMGLNGLRPTFCATELDSKDS